MTFKKSICLQLFLRKNVYEWYCNNVLYTVCKDVLLVCGEGLATKKSSNLTRTNPNTIL